jgi:hypothetical protein
MMSGNILDWMIQKIEYVLFVNQGVSIQQKMEVESSVATPRCALFAPQLAWTAIRLLKLQLLNQSSMSAKNTQKTFLRNVHLALGEF